MHDPALVKGGPGQKWYVFASGKPDKGGGTIDVRSSADNGRTWTYDGTVWDAMPAWLHQTVPGANNMWAPAVHQHGGTYYLYYAVSTTGHNDSVIGLATNTTLDRTNPAYKWVDQGKVVRSLPASDFNAIDPEVIEDDAGTPWLVFGSYWSGIQMVQLEWPSGKRSADRTRHPPRRPQGRPSTRSRRRRSCTATAGSTCSPRGTGAAWAWTAPTGSSWVGPRRSPAPTSTATASR